MMLDDLSQEHPLRDDPGRWWPYAVVVGYRLRTRQIVKRRTVYVRECGPASAEHTAVMYARDHGPIVRDEMGRILKASRAVSVRPLDLSDCIGSAY